MYWPEYVDAEHHAGVTGLADKLYYENTLARYTLHFNYISSASTLGNGIRNTYSNVGFEISTNAPRVVDHEIFGEINLQLQNRLYYRLNQTRYVFGLLHLQFLENTLVNGIGMNNVWYTHFSATNVYTKQKVNFTVYWGGDHIIGKSRVPTDWHISMIVEGVSTGQGEEHNIIALEGLVAEQIICVLNKLLAKLRERA